MSWLIRAILRLDIPWWGWVLLVLSALIGFGIFARSLFRRGVRDRLRSYFAEHASEIEIINETATTFEVRIGENTGSLNLLSLYHALANQRVEEDGDEEKELFANFVAMMRESQHAAILDPTKDRTRILPRLQPPNFVESIPGGNTLPTRAIESLGLIVCYVIDSPHSVRYLDCESMNDLNLGDDELFDLAMENIKTMFPRSGFEDVLDKKAIVTVKTGDTFEAARILAIPSQLEDGESLIAIISDRDTLLLMPFAEGLDWDGMAKKLGKPDTPDRALLRRAVKVSASGFNVQ